MTDGTPEACPCNAADCSARLAKRLRAFVTAVLAELDNDLLPGLRLPTAEAGHLIRDNTRVDLSHVAALLIEHGTDAVGDTPLRQLVHSTLLPLDGAAVDGFFSYRLAETARLLGGLEALQIPLADVVVEGSAAVTLRRRISAGEPVRRNFLVVAARCYHERRLLGLEEVGAGSLAIDAAVAIFERGGWIADDSRWPDNFDIYTPDMYLLAQPFADALGPGWAAGFNRVVDDLTALGSPLGAVVWGRSIGVLAEAMTIELAALSAHRGRQDSSLWLGRASETLSRLGRWFHRGLLMAHRRKSSDAYRGPSRRLQMTFDVLGKLLVSARWLEVTGHHLPVETRKEKLWEDVDRYVVFGSGDAGAWAYRSHDLSFVIPVVGGPTAEYAVAPRWPGAFEQPPAGPPTFVPTVLIPGRGNHDEYLLPTGSGSSVVHRPGELHVTSRGWWRQDGAGLDGSRVTRFTARGRLLVADELVDVPTQVNASVSVMLASGDRRPVLGSVDKGTEFFTSPVEGVSEWQTPWGAYDLVSHITGQAAAPFTWSAGRGIVVASSDIDHPYNQALYSHIPQHVRVVDAGRPTDGLAGRLQGVDVFHLSWPERWSGRILADQERAIRIVRDSGARIVWTMHNLLPHKDRNETGSAIYAAWAGAADAVIHHSEYGLARALNRFVFARNVLHEVIPHGHWGDLITRHSTLSRTEVEADEGWGRTGLRLAVVGQPRPEKHLETVIAAARACGRRDIQFVIRTIPEHNHLATDRVRLEHGHLSAERYFRRFVAYDGLILPFDAGDMLGSGTVFDCLGAGIAAIGPSWGFQQEVLGAALINYEPGHLVDLLRTLDLTMVSMSAEAMRARRPEFDWTPIGLRTAALFLQQCGLPPGALNALTEVVPGRAAL